MLKKIIVIVSSFFLASCGQNEAPGQNQTTTGSVAVDSVAIVNDPKSNLNVQTNSFSEIDSSGILLFPLSMGETERSGSGLSYKSMPNGGYWNIVFYNSKTNQYHLLSDKKMLITNYDFKYTDDDHTNIAQTARQIFYSITTEDCNGDKKFTEEDAHYLFVTDREGNNFKQISPPKYDLQTWKFIRSSNKVIMTLKKDSDNNKAFDEKDEVSTFEFDIDKSIEAKEIFPNEFKNKLKVLYDRDWKRLKK